MSNVSVEFIDRILELAKPEIIEVGDRKFSTRLMNAVEDPEPATIKIQSMTGILDFIEAEKIPVDDLFLHIVDIDKVSLSGKIFGPNKQRVVFCYASAETHNFKFNNFYDVESFIIALQTAFVQDENTAALLSILGTLTDGSVRTISDDGVTQTVNVKEGIQRKAQAKVPNPVTLRPFVTFSEIEQPEQLFVFRMKAGSEMPACGLFEAGSKMWRNDVFTEIKEWFNKHASGLKVVG